MGARQATAGNGGRGKVGPSAGPVDVVRLALEAFLRAGGGWAEFWNRTAFETQLIVKAHFERQYDAHDLAMKAAWTAELLSRNDFERRPMKLQDFLIDRAGRSAEPVSEEEIGRKFFRWLDYEERALAQ